MSRKLCEKGLALGTNSVSARPYPVLVPLYSVFCGSSTYCNTNTMKYKNIM